MEVKVIVDRRPNMFDVQRNLLSFVGLGQLEQLMTDYEFKVQGGVLELLYPERFLNVIEQRLLLERAEVAGFDSVKIETHSVYIIQTVDNRNTGVKSVQSELTQETKGPFKKSMS